MHVCCAAEADDVDRGCRELVVARGWVDPEGDLAVEAAATDGLAIAGRCALDIGPGSRRAETAAELLGGAVVRRERSDVVARLLQLLMHLLMRGHHLGRPSCAAQRPYAVPFRA